MSNQPPAAIKKQLAQGLIELGLDMDAAQQQSFLAYLLLMQKWGRLHNLTAIRELSQMVSQHVLDSLSVLPFLAGQHVLDVGSGAGLPGIPLAIARPELTLSLVESNAKKTRFLSQVKLELGLQNIAIENCRVENFQSSEKFDTLIMRAFAPMEKLLPLVDHLLTTSGRLIVMKGAYPESELSNLPSTYRVETVQALSVPGLAAQRHVVVLTRA